MTTALGQSVVTDPTALTRMLTKGFNCSKIQQTSWDIYKNISWSVTRAHTHTVDEMIVTR